jgi:hypothetical protein
MVRPEQGGQAHARRITARAATMKILCFSIEISFNSLQSYIFAILLWLCNQRLLAIQASQKKVDI